MSRHTVALEEEGVYAWPTVYRTISIPANIAAEGRKARVNLQESEKAD